MSTFKYSAIASNGKNQNGTVDADNVKQARVAIKSKGLTPISVEPLNHAAGLSGSNPSRLNLLLEKPPMNQANLAVWTRQLSSLVSAGLNIEKALQSLVDASSNQKQSSMISEITAQVQSGSPLSAALGAYPRVFTPIYCAVVTAGEGTGTLPAVLTSLADGLEEAQALKSKVFGAALYPAVVSGMALVIVGFLMVYVVPQVAEAFSSSKQTLPLLTRAMLATSDLLKTNWIAFVGTAAMSLVIARVLLRDQDKLRTFHAALLNLPAVGSIIANYNAARYASTLGILTAAGVPIVNAMRTANNTVANTAMRADLEDVTSLVREGAPLGAALAAKKSCPKLVATFAKLGTETGTLGLMLQRVGKQLADDVKNRCVKAASVLEPLLIFAMGIVVMMIVLSVMLPIIELNNFVS